MAEAMQVELREHEVLPMEIDPGPAEAEAQPMEIDAVPAKAEAEQMEVDEQLFPVRPVPSWAQ